jgi:hypothetical protein
MSHKKAKLLRKKQVDWRARVTEVGYEQYKIELDEEIRAVQEARKLQLRKRFPSATFQTLDGEVF